jgi:hypothetical protein
VGLLVSGLLFDSQSVLDSSLEELAHLPSKYQSGLICEQGVNLEADSGLLTPAAWVLDEVCKVLFHC